MKRNVFVGYGSTNKTTGEKFTVIAYEGCNNITVRFEDGYVTKTCSANVISGRIKNPYFKRNFGIGFKGEGPYSPSRHRYAYLTWVNMLKRCIPEKQTGKLSSYRGCTVCEPWHNFQNFAEWYETQPFKGTGFFLDKDLLHKGNKVYGPSACSLVPREINNVLVDSCKEDVCVQAGESGNYYVRTMVEGKYKHIGTFQSMEAANCVFKETKEREVKRLAEKYKDVLKAEVYTSLTQWEV